MFCLPRSSRFALFAFLSNPWIGVGMSACLTCSFDPISASGVMNRSRQTKARWQRLTKATLKRLWYIYTAANHELYKEECGAILSDGDHVVCCLYFLLSSVGGNRDYLYKDLSDLIVLYTKEDSTTVQGVKFLLKHRYPTFSLRFTFPLAYYKKSGASPQGKYSIYGCLDMMFAPKSSWRGQFTGCGNKCSKKILEELIKKHDGMLNFFYEDLSDLERSIFSILAESEVTHCFLKNPLFKRDIGFCMPFYKDVFPGKLTEYQSPLHVVNHSSIQKASCFIDKIVSNPSIDLTRTSEEVIQSMKQHSLF